MVESLAEALRRRERVLEYRDNQSVFRLIDTLPQLYGVEVEYADTVIFNTTKATTKDNLSHNTIKEIFLEVARKLIPWKKGPFRLFDTVIISEWDSSVKFNLLEPHLNVQNKRVCDIGANNGYYSLRLLPYNPREVIAIDPVAHCKAQFSFLNKLYPFTTIDFKLLGIEELELLSKERGEFDVLLALGILYHRKDPLNTLKSLFNALHKKGELFLDTLILDGEAEIALAPSKRYAKMPNVFFIPTVNTLIGWLHRVGFKEIQHLCTLKTTPKEQRVSEWGSEESLEDFLDNTQEKTIEGYPAPKRAYFKAIKC